jgi:MFS family permease
MPITGAAVVGASLLAFSRLHVDTTYHVVAVIMFFFGAGLGLTMQVVITAVQNSVDRKNMGAATAAVTFFRSMGGALGTALFGAILNTRLAQHLTEIVPPAAQAQLGTVAASANDISAIRGLPEPVKTWVLTAFTEAMNDMFLVGVPFMAAAVLIAVFMTEKPLAGRAQSVISDASASQPDTITQLAP